VGESVLFRNFGSKAELFEMTILTPFSEFVDDWATTWDAKTTAATDPEQVAEAFVKGFYNLGVVRRVLLEHGAARHFRTVDAPVTVAVAVGSVLSLVLLDDWLFSHSQRRPGKARQIKEAAQMLLYGVAGPSDA
jgi:hypothetical protein